MLDLVLVYLYAVADFLGDIDVTGWPLIAAAVAFAFTGKLPE
ncbi:MAG TPA: hypothetical protein VKA48_13150 [Gammaproteobacteria bacterium]|nr:hypothetical protein [Gammaproteobacteria bacterium]